MAITTTILISILSSMKDSEKLAGDFEGVHQSSMTRKYNANNGKTSNLLSYFFIKTSTKQPDKRARSNETGNIDRLDAGSRRYSEGDSLKQKSSSYIQNTGYIDGKAIHLNNLLSDIDHLISVEDSSSLYSKTVIYKSFRLVFGLLAGIMENKQMPKTMLHPVGDFVMKYKAYLSGLKVKDKMHNWRKSQYMQADLAAHLDLEASIGSFGSIIQKIVFNGGRGGHQSPLFEALYDDLMNINLMLIFNGTNNRIDNIVEERLIGDLDHQEALARNARNKLMKYKRHIALIKGSILYDQVCTVAESLEKLLNSHKIDEVELSVLATILDKTVNLFEKSSIVSEEENRAKQQLRAFDQQHYDDLRVKIAHSIKRLHLHTNGSANTEWLENFLSSLDKLEKTDNGIVERLNHESNREIINASEVLLYLEEDNNQNVSGYNKFHIGKLAPRSKLLSLIKDFSIIYGRIATQQKTNEYSPKKLFEFYHLVLALYDNMKVTTANVEDQSYIYSQDGLNDLMTFFKDFETQIKKGRIADGKIPEIALMHKYLDELAFVSSSKSPFHENSDLNTNNKSICIILPVENTARKYVNLASLNLIEHVSSPKELQTNSIENVTANNPNDNSTNEKLASREHSFYRNGMTKVRQNNNFKPQIVAVELKTENLARFFVQTRNLKAVKNSNFKAYSPIISTIQVLVSHLSKFNDIGEIIQFNDLLMANLDILIESATIVGFESEDYLNLLFKFGLFEMRILKNTCIKLYNLLAGEKNNANAATLMKIISELVVYLTVLPQKDGKIIETSKLQFNDDGYVHDSNLEVVNSILSIEYTEVMNEKNKLQREIVKLLAIIDLESFALKKSKLENRIVLLMGYLSHYVDQNACGLNSIKEYGKLLRISQDILYSAKYSNEPTGKESNVLRLSHLYDLQSQLVKLDIDISKKSLKDIITTGLNKLVWNLWNYINEIEQDDKYGYESVSYEQDLIDLFGQRQPTDSQSTSNNRIETGMPVDILLTDQTTDQQHEMKQTSAVSSVDNTHIEDNNLLKKDHSEVNESSLPNNVVISSAFDGEREHKDRGTGYSTPKFDSLKSYSNPNVSDYNEIHASSMTRTEITNMRKKEHSKNPPANRQGMYASSQVLSYNHDGKLRESRDTLVAAISEYLERHPYDKLSHNTVVSNSLNQPVKSVQEYVIDMDDSDPAVKRDVIDRLTSLIDDASRFSKLLVSDKPFEPNSYEFTELLSNLKKRLHDAASVINNPLSPVDNSIISSIRSLESSLELLRDYQSSNVIREANRNTSVDTESLNSASPLDLPAKPVRLRILVLLEDIDCAACMKSELIREMFRSLDPIV